MSSNPETMISLNFTWDINLIGDFDNLIDHNIILIDLFMKHNKNKCKCDHKQNMHQSIMI